MDELRASLRRSAIGVVIALLTFLYGSVAGAVLGLNERPIKSWLNDRAQSVIEPVYSGDMQKISRAIDSSWLLMRRSHLHAEGMATGAMAMILLVVVIGGPAVITRWSSIGLGLGSAAYATALAWAGARTPLYGDPAVAKETLKWLAMPAGGLYMSSTVAVLGLVIWSMKSRTSRPARASRIVEPKPRRSLTPELAPAGSA